jgi:hypothetical protein
MRDILMDIYNVLMTDEDIQDYPIYFNEYPELSEINDVHIVIDEVDDSLPEEYADNDNMALSYLVQIDVYTKVKTGVNARLLRDKISYKISRLLKENLQMENTSNGKPEYDGEFKLYRSARRYEGVYYREGINLN